MKKIILLLLGLLILSCSKSEDGFVLNKTVDPDPSANVDVQNFMWKAMNFWYFWQVDVPDLADDRFPITDAGSAEYTNFLLSETNPGDFFDNKLLHAEDRFSFYSDDYRELTQSLAGISKSNGLEFGLSYIEEGGNAILGYVRYIVPNSDAATKDIGRGEIFTGVDGTTLTNENYRNLLFGDNDTYTLNMADITNNEVVPNDKEVALTKIAGLVENPVFLSKTFHIGGEIIGYLVYNGFTNEFDEDLNNAFGNFKSEGITSLVLDLRYNPGGSVNTTRLLGSMIYSKDTDNLFLKRRYNAKVQPQLGSKYLDVHFAKETEKGSDINTLNLDKVYVITTNSSASASELLINCLEPYINVVHIGETTRGKNEFSVTMVDDRENAYLYNPSRVNEIKKNNQWAIQPLVGRNENADGFFDYTSGLTPDIELREDLTNLGVLGDQNEPLLARAIQEITGTSGKRGFEVSMPANIMTSSKMFAPLKDNMYDNTPLNISIE